MIFQGGGGGPVLVYCRELAPSTVSLTGDRAQGDDSKHDSHYKPVYLLINQNCIFKIMLFHHHLHM